jgi:hypothetical protein
MCNRRLLLEFKDSLPSLARRRHPLSLSLINAICNKRNHVRRQMTLVAQFPTCFFYLFRHGIVQSGRIIPEKKVFL